MARLEFSIDRLIKEVQKRRMLYDTTTDEYRNKNAKESEWLEVCREVCTTNTEIIDWDNLSETEKTDFLIEVKKKWTSLRDCFKREQRMFEKNQHNKKKYLFFDKLKFLEPFNRIRGPPKPKPANNEAINIVKEEIIIDDDYKAEIVSSCSDSEGLDENPLSKFVKCKNTTNTIKILTPQELQKIGANQIMIIENSDMNRTLHDDDRDVDNRKRKRDRSSDDYEKNKIRIKEYNEDSGETSEYEVKRETEDKNTGDEDDQAFLKSILPTFKALSTEQKFRLRIEIMQTILKFKVDNKISN